MDRIFDLIAVAIFNRLGGDEQKLQPGNPNRIRHNTLHRGPRFVDTLMNHNFHIAPDIVSQHDNLEKSVVIFKSDYNPKKGQLVQSLENELFTFVGCSEN